MDDYSLEGCLIGLLVRMLIKALPYLLVIALVIWLAQAVVPSLENVLKGIELPAIPKVSGPATEPQVGQTTGGAPGTYTVQEGDMLSKIAKKFDTSVEVLVELNKDRYPSLKTNPGLIQPGWELTVRSTSVSGSLPVSTPRSTPPAQTRRIGIEAGHGDGDSGAHTHSEKCIHKDKEKVEEQSITIAVAQRTAKILRENGYQVDVFRGDEEGTRPKSEIIGYRADVFISLHTDQCAGNFSCFKISRYGGAPLTGKNGSGDASDRLVDALWTAYDAATGLSKCENPGHYPDRMLNYGRLNPDGGIAPSTPGAIIEMGWLSGNLAFMISPEGQDRMAQGIANGIVDYLQAE